VTPNPRFNRRSPQIRRWNFTTPGPTNQGQPVGLCRRNGTRLIKPHLRRGELQSQSPEDGFRSVRRPAPGGGKKKKRESEPLLRESEPLEVVFGLSDLNRILHACINQTDEEFHANYMVSEPWPRGQKMNPQINIGDCNKFIHTRATSRSARSVKDIMHFFFHFFGQAIMPWTWNRSRASCFCQRASGQRRRRPA